MELARAVEHLATLLLVFQEGLLAKRRAEDNCRLRSHHVENARHEFIHLLISEEDRILVLRLLIRARLYLETELWRSELTLLV